MTNPKSRLPWPRMSSALIGLAWPILPAFCEVRAFPTIEDLFGGVQLALPYPTELLLAIPAGVLTALGVLVGIGLCVKDRYVDRQTALASNAAALFILLGLMVLVILALFLPMTPALQGVGA